ncbi:DUF6801 domain-containing protein [Actinomadura barringtoniae]|uniref:DUF6801 domain-containing protein n=1 Tax=Actinomadura barringtoniae TaxID=1427535 RepID=UPI0027DD6F3B|nr:DUF6801 domain-containing protein [Actinomadura barringtoniae]
MKSKKKAGTAKGVLAVAVGGAVAASSVAGIVGAGPASADPVKIKLNYHCTFPLIGSQPIAVEISTDVPKTVAVGQTMAGFKVDSTSTVSADSTRGLKAVLTKTLEGHALATASLSVPEEPEGLPVDVDSLLDKTTLPDSGEFTIHGLGTSPDLVFTKPGPGKVTVGDLVLTLTPKLDDGGESGLGTFESECSQDPGQNNVLATFDITGPTPTPTPTPPTPTPTPPTPTPTPPTPTPTPPTPTPTPPTPTPTPPTPTPTKQHFDFGLKGETFVKAPNGKAPLTGSVGADLDLNSGAVDADLKLDPTKGNFQILGFLPVTADIALVPQGRTGGTYTSGQLTTTSKVLTKLTSFKAFGAVPIGGGDQCQTDKPSDITLKSKAGEFFDPAKGGDISGDYELSSINNCGPLTGILSLFTAGKGNTINLTLTPRS